MMKRVVKLTCTAALLHDEALGDFDLGFENFSGLLCFFSSSFSACSPLYTRSPAPSSRSGVHLLAIPSSSEPWSRMCRWSFRSPSSVCWSGAGASGMDDPVICGWDGGMKDLIPLDLRDHAKGLANTRSDRQSFSHVGTEHETMDAGQGAWSGIPANWGNGKPAAVTSNGEPLGGVLEVTEWVLGWRLAGWILQVTTGST